jgi:hypothetical protein
MRILQNGGNKMSEHLPVKYMTKIIFGDGMGLDDVGVDDESPDPLAEFTHRNQIQAALKSAGGEASCILDLSVPAGDVDDDDAPLYRSPRIVHGAIRKSQGKAFIQVLAKIREIFAGHDDEMHAVIEIVTRMRDDARAEAMARLAASE